MKHRRKMLAFLAVVCMISFGITGAMLEVMRGFGRKSGPPGEVFGKPISWKEVNQFAGVQVRVSRSGRIDESALLHSFAELKLAQRAELSVSKDEIARDIHRTPWFQAYDDGSKRSYFNPESYYMYLKGKGLTPAEYEGLVANLLLQSKLREYLGNSQLVTTGEAWLDYKSQNRQYKVDHIVLEAKDFLEQVSEPTEEEVKAQYVGNRDKVYSEPEKRRLEYLQVAYQDFLDEAKVDEADMKKYYQDNRFRYRIFEEKPQAPDAGPEGSVEQETETEADTSGEEVRDKSEPGDSSAVGESASQEADTEESAEAADHSTEPKYKSFEEVKAEIEETLKKDRVRTLACQKLQGARDELRAEKGLTFADLAKIHPDITLGRTEFFSQVEAGTLSELSSAFSEEGKFADIVFTLDEELDVPTSVMPGENHAYVFRLAERRPKQAIPFEEVRDKVVSDLKDQRTFEKTKARARELSQKMTAEGKTLPDIASAHQLEVKTSEYFIAGEAPDFALGISKWKKDEPQVVPVQPLCYLAVLTEVVEPSYSDFEKEKEQARQRLRSHNRLRSLLTWADAVAEETNLKDFLTSRGEEPEPD